MIPAVLPLIGRRLLASVLILLAVSALLFVVLHALPVDPAAMSLPPNATLAEIDAKRQEMGLDRPLPQQYLIWLSHVIHGDLGSSIHYRRSVVSLVAATLPATIELAVLSIIIAAVLGLAGGLILFHVRGTGMDIFGSALRHMILPSFALGIAFSPAIMRVLRSSLIDVYQEDYIHTARLRGLGEGRILLRHALKNAFLPTLSLMGVQFGFLFGGTLLVELIFSYPGLGSLMVDAVRNADLPIVQLVGLAYCVVVLAINTVVDSLYLLLNPKLRLR